MVELGPFLRCRPDGRPRLMGILNVTPDSFHADSRVTQNDAVVRGLEMWNNGADWVDIGGESTRPGAEPIGADEEEIRVIPVIRELRAANPSGLISIDTRRVSVAAAALEAGANMINDVSGLRDQQMQDLVIEQGCCVCIMHMQGEPGNMQTSPEYKDVKKDVAEYLLRRADDLVANGHDSQLICVDPGIGFGKTVEHNIELLKSRGFEKYSVMWGVSRKSMFKQLLGREETDERLAGTLGVAAHAMMEGIDILRVHDVEAHSDLLTTIATLQTEDFE